VAMMSAVEPCRTWVARGNRQSKLVFPRKCGHGERRGLLVSLDGDFGFGNDH
jgi:hypothetical protein